MALVKKSHDSILIRDNTDWCTSIGVGHLLDCKRVRLFNELAALVCRSTLAAVAVSLGGIPCTNKEVILSVHGVIRDECVAGINIDCSLLLRLLGLLLLFHVIVDRGLELLVLVLGMGPNLHLVIEFGVVFVLTNEEVPVPFFFCKLAEEFLELILIGSPLLCSIVSSPYILAVRARDNSRDILAAFLDKHLPGNQVLDAVHQDGGVGVGPHVVAKRHWTEKGLV